MNYSNKSLIVVLTALVAALMVSLLECSADLMNNLIEDERNQVHNSRLNRGRHALVVSCKTCPSSECQVMGMQRYAEPRCEPLGGLGAPCRPYQEPDNKTLHFPSAIMYCNDVYMQFCPCAQGLLCDPELSECKIDSAAASALDSDAQQPEVGASSRNSDSAALAPAPIDASFGEYPSESDHQYGPVGIAFEPMLQYQQQQQRQQQNMHDSGKFPWAV